MTLLLDTHVLLWALVAPHRLGDGLRRVLTLPDARVLFSAASVWEVAIKQALGRVDFNFEPDTVAQAAIDTDFEPLPVTHQHAARVRQLPLLHADPFDRLLIAQAQVEGVQLVTADRALMPYPAPVRWIEDF